MLNEHEKFLLDLKNDQPTGEDPFAQGQQAPEKEEQEVEQTKDKEVEEDGIDFEGLGVVKPKNRRERRLLRRLEAERNSSMYFAGERAKEKETTTEESVYLKEVDMIYGNDTPEKILASQTLKKALLGVREEAKREAIAEIRAERERELEAVKKADDELDNVLDEIEDTYQVELNAAQEKAYFQLLKRMSPKDREGNVIGLADPHAVWDVFQDKLNSSKKDSRAKELSNRSMVQSGAATGTTVQMDSEQRYLRDLGII